MVLHLCRDAYSARRAFHFRHIKLLRQFRAKFTSQIFKRTEFRLSCIIYSLALLYFMNIGLWFTLFLAFFPFDCSSFCVFFFSFSQGFPIYVLLFALPPNAFFSLLSSFFLTQLITILFPMHSTINNVCEGHSLTLFCFQHPCIFS